MVESMDPEEVIALLEPEAIFQSIDPKDLVELFEPGKVAELLDSEDVSELLFLIFSKGSDRPVNTPEDLEDIIPKGNDPDDLKNDLAEAVISTLGRPNASAGKKPDFRLESLKTEITGTGGNRNASLWNTNFDRLGAGLNVTRPGGATDPIGPALNVSVNIGENGGGRGERRSGIQGLKVTAGIDLHAGGNEDLNSSGHSGSPSLNLAAGVSALNTGGIGGYGNGNFSQNLGTEADGAGSGNRRPNGSDPRDEEEQGSVSGDNSHGGGSVEASLGGGDSGPQGSGSVSSSSGSGSVSHGGGSGNASSSGSSGSLSHGGGSGSVGSSSGSGSLTFCDGFGSVSSGSGSGSASFGHGSGMGDLGSGSIGFGEGGGRVHASAGRGGGGGGRGRGLLRYILNAGYHLLDANGGGLAIGGVL